MDEIQQRHRKEMIDFFYHLKRLSQERLEEIITEKYEFIKEYSEKVKESTKLRNYGTLTHNIKTLYNSFGLNPNNITYTYYNDDPHGGITNRHINNIVGSLYTFIQHDEVHDMEPKSEYNIFFSFTIHRPNGLINNIYTERQSQKRDPVLFKNDYYTDFPITAYVSGAFNIYNRSTIVDYIIEYFLVIIELINGLELVNPGYMWTPHGPTNRTGYDGIKNVENNHFPTIIETCVEKGIPDHIVLYIVSMDERIKHRFYKSLDYRRFNPKDRRFNPKV